MDGSTRRAKIDDVARLAGVSTKTVSRVLNNEPNVREATRARVRAAAKALNYMPDFSARSLAGQKSYLIAMFYDTASQAYLSQFQAGALVQCGEYGYHLIVERCDVSSPGAGQRVAGIAARLRVDGVILLPPLSNHSEVVQKVAASDVPFVQIVPADVSVAACYLNMDDARAADELTTYLIGLGHRRIGHIKGHPAHGASVQRYQGYCAALARAGIALDALLVNEGLFDIRSGEKAGRELLEGAHPPTAIFAANDDMAAGAINAARGLGLDVPTDLSIVGFDDSQIASVTYPPLTTVRQPIEDMARGSVDLLIEAIKENGGTRAGKPRFRHFGFDLVERGSAAPLRKP